MLTVSASPYPGQDTVAVRVPPILKATTNSIELVSSLIIYAILPHKICLDSVKLWVNPC